MTILGMWKCVRDSCPCLHTIKPLTLVFRYSITSFWGDEWQVGSRSSGRKFSDPYSTLISPISLFLLFFFFFFCLSCCCCFSFFFFAFLSASAFLWPRILFSLLPSLLSSSLQSLHFFFTNTYILNISITQYFKVLVVFNEQAWHFLDFRVGSWTYYLVLFKIYFK